MEFVIQKLHASLQPEQHLVLARSRTFLHSHQGAWDSGCALHCAAMALAMLGRLPNPCAVRHEKGPTTLFWRRAQSFYLSGIALAELANLLQELNQGLRPVQAEGEHETVLRFIERELALGWPLIVSWRLPRGASLHAALAIGREGRRRARRFEPDTLLLLDPAEPEPGP